MKHQCQQCGCEFETHALSQEEVEFIKSTHGFPGKCKNYYEAYLVLEGKCEKCAEHFFNEMEMELDERKPNWRNGEYSLVGQDGNAFFLLGYVNRCLKREHFTKEDVDNCDKLAMQGDYTHLVGVLDKYIDLCNRARMARIYTQTM